jgi:hypothetical protein
MTLGDVQQQRLLVRLRQAGDRPVAFAELHAGGVHFPAAVACELGLAGYAIERVYDHGRLVGVRAGIPAAWAQRGYGPGLTCRSVPSLGVAHSQIRLA